MVKFLNLKKKQTKQAITKEIKRSDRGVCGLVKAQSPQSREDIEKKKRRLDPQWAEMSITDVDVVDDDDDTEINFKFKILLEYEYKM